MSCVLVLRVRVSVEAEGVEMVAQRARVCVGGVSRWCGGSVSDGVRVGEREAVQWHLGIH